MAQKRATRKRTTAGKIRTLELREIRAVKYATPDDNAKVLRALAREVGAKYRV